MVETTRREESQLALGARIRQARERLKISQQDLATRAGLPAAQSVSQIENGTRDVKAAELARIAQALHVGVIDLLAPPRPPTRLLWREKPSDLQRKAEVEVELVRIAHDYHLAEIWANAPSTVRLDLVSEAPRLNDYSYAENLAKEACRHLSLGSRPATALVRTLEEEASVKILWREDLPGSAACFRDDDNAVIVVNASEAPWRRNFNVAHELFHLLTWRVLPPEILDESPEQCENAECLANHFAAALLLPAEAIMERVGEPPKGTEPPIDLIFIAREFDVSVEALVWRLVSLRWLRRATAEEWLTNTHFRTQDRLVLRQWITPPSLPDRFLNLLLCAYEKGNVSAGRIAEMTGQNLADVRLLLETDVA